MIQEKFAYNVVDTIREDPEVLGLAAAGSWITKELDEYSDLDLVLFTKEKVGGNKESMMNYARSFGDFISGFTGEHVGEPRVLICLYDNPLLHVDIKFLTLEEFHHRVENPVILYERNHVLTNNIQSTKAEWPPLDYQWIEDRFWTWVHYGAVKIGRGELMEAFDFLSYLRMTVLSPLLQVKNGLQPRGLRKVETQLIPADLAALSSTIAKYERASIITALQNAIELYRSLRKELYTHEVRLQVRAEEVCVKYLLSVDRLTG